jgi:hypothetical protein
MISIKKGNAYIVFSEASPDSKSLLNLFKGSRSVYVYGDYRQFLKKYRRHTLRSFAGLFKNIDLLNIVTCRLDGIGNQLDASLEYLGWTDKKCLCILDSISNYDVVLADLRGSDFNGCYSLIDFVKLLDPFLAHKLVIIFAFPTSATRIKGVTILNLKEIERGEIQKVFDTYAEDRDSQEEDFMLTQKHFKKPLWKKLLSYLMISL